MPNSLHGVRGLEVGDHSVGKVDPDRKRLSAPQNRRRQWQSKLHRFRLV